MSDESKDDKRIRNENGFYCEVCDCTVKDSLNYLDHVNGKQHNRNLGISLNKFTDSTLEEVKEMLELKKRERDERNVGYSTGDEADEDQEDRWRQMKRDKKKRQKARRSGLLVDKDDADDDADSDENKVYKDDEGNHDSMEDEMAKMMGFTNFGSSKK